METKLIQCPINNGADLCSDCLLDALFDDGQYVKNEPQTNHFEVLGFINGVPIVADYWLRTNSLKVKAIRPITTGGVESFRTLLKERLSDEQVKLVIYATETAGEYEARFYYAPKYAEQNLG